MKTYQSSGGTGRINKIDQNMPKMRIYWKKVVQSPQRRDLHAVQLPPADIALSSAFLVLNVVA